MSPLFMKKLLTKKNIVIVFGISALLLAILHPQWVRTLCYDNDLPCVSIWMFLLPFVWGCLPASVIVYFLRDEIFYSWLKFIAWWLPLGSLMAFITSDDSGIIGNLFSSQFFAFTIISMSGCVFALKSWELHRTDLGNPLAWWIKWPSLVIAFILSIILSAYIYGLFW